jgi:hypothetical protein
MKKVSEVQKELDAFGCQAERVTDLMVASGLLEKDKVNLCEVGKVYAFRMEEYGWTRIFKVTETTETYAIGTNNLVIFHRKEDNPWQHESWSIHVALAECAEITEIK